MDLFVTLEEMYSGNFIEVSPLNFITSTANACLYVCLLDNTEQAGSQDGAWYAQMQLQTGDADHSDGARSLSNDSARSL